jgi:hypothetical protein
VDLAKNWVVTNEKQQMLGCLDANADLGQKSRKHAVRITVLMPVIAQ